MASLDSLKGTAFSPGGKGGSDNEVQGDTKEPYEQFEKCRHIEDFKCKFIMNDGGCIYETCIFDDHVPPRVLLWYFRCVICDEEDSIKPEEMRVPFCRSCIKRMLRAEKLPHNCVFCGKPIHRPAILFMSGLCDDCASDIYALIKWYRMKRRRGWSHPSP